MSSLAPDHARRAPRRVGLSVGVLLGASLIGSATGSLATELAWRQLGPASGDILALTRAPGASSPTFAAASGGGVFATFENGNSWLGRNSNLPNLDAQTVFADGSELWSGHQNGRVWRSTNHGSTWAAASDGLGNAAVSAFTRTANGELFLSTTGAGVWRFDGATWQSSSGGLGSNFVQTVLAHSSDPQILWASTVVGLYRSLDGGASWQSSQSGLEGEFVWALATDPAQPNTLWAGTASGSVYRSTNAAASFTDYSTGLSSSQIADLELVGSDLYAASADGVYRRALSDSSWHGLGFGLPTSVRSLTATSAGLLAGTSGRGVWFLANGSGLWSERNAGLLSSFALTLSAGPGDTVRLGTSGGGFWIRQPDTIRTSDGWEARSSGLQALFVAALSGDPITGDLYAGTIGKGIDRSENDGLTWSPDDEALENAFVRRIDHSPTGHQLAATSGGVYRRPGAGTPWSASGLAGEDVRAMASKPTATPQWVAGTSGGEVHESSNDGFTWTLLADLGSRVADLVFDTAQSLVVGTDGGVWWQTGSTAFDSCGLAGERVSSLLFFGPELYAGTLDSGVWQRTGGCAAPSTWHRLAAGLPHTGIYDLALITTTSGGPQRIGAATFGGGVFALEPVLPLFADGFESGDTGVWSQTHP